jgi:hypothetical protein
MEDLPFLQQLAFDDAPKVRAEAVKAIMKIETYDGIQNWLIGQEHRLPDDVLQQLDQFLYAPAWWKAYLSRLDGEA